MPGRRTLTVPDPDDWAFEAQEEVCRLCEGDGQLARDFSIESIGAPAVIDCPYCGGKGRTRVVATSFVKEGTALVITFREDDFLRFMEAGAAVAEQLMEGRS